MTEKRAKKFLGSEQNFHVYINNWASNRDWRETMFLEYTQGRQFVMLTQKFIQLLIKDTLCAVQLLWFHHYLVDWVLISGG